MDFLTWHNGLIFIAGFMVGVLAMLALMVFTFKKYK